MRRPLLVLFASLLVCRVAIAETLATADLSIDMYRIRAEVAVTEAERERGLMFRRQLAPQQGMLFVFDEPQRVCMWMKNTLLPLSVAFIDAKEQIINIEDMQAQTETTHCAQRAASYALEMNLGWFKARGIKPGAKIRGIAAPAKR